MKNKLGWIFVSMLGASSVVVALGCLYAIEYEQFPILESSAPLVRYEPMKVLFLGDMMLDRTLRKRGEEKGYPFIFECMKDTFSQYDEVVVNLEGTVTQYESVSRDAAYLAPESFRFTFDPAALDAAVESGITIFGLANNHIFDYGREGVLETIKNLSERNLGFFGNPLDEDSSLSIDTDKNKTYAHINKPSIVIVPFNEFFGSKDANKKETLAGIEKAKQESPHATIVVFAHWGDEYVPASDRVKGWAYEFIDAGADVIIGTHPHVIQEVEIYKDARIYYSLGNFIFDQYWEEAVRTGIAVEMVIDAKKPPEFREIMLDIDRSGQTCPRQQVVI